MADLSAIPQQGIFSVVNADGSLLLPANVALTATFTRPADTTAYASGDLMANSTTAGSVTNMSITAARIAAGRGYIQSIHVRKSGTSVTNATFRVHVFTAAPTYQTNGDNSAMSGNMLTGMASRIGYFDVTMGSAGVDGAGGVALPPGNIPIPFKLSSGQTLYLTMEAQAAYTPASAEVFTIIANVLQH